jgi:hypothetical protein
MGKPMGRHPITHYKNPNEPLAGSTKQVRSYNLCSAWAFHLRPTCRSPKRFSNLTNISSKLGRWPTGPQHSPVTRPESLRSRKRYFKGLELRSSCLDLLLHLSLLLNELLDHLLYNRPFQALFHCHNHLVQLQALSFDLFKHRLGFILHLL